MSEKGTKCRTGAETVAMFEIDLLPTAKRRPIDSKGTENPREKDRRYFKKKLLCCACTRIVQVFFFNNNMICVSGDVRWEYYGANGGRPY